MADTIPIDTHAIGDTGHVTDHNNIADMLGLLTQLLAQYSNASNTPPSGNSANVSAVSTNVASPGASLFLNDHTSALGSPGSGVWVYSVGGQLLYTSSVDSIAYDTGRSTQIITANQTISSATAVVVGANSNPMSWSVGIGQYMIVGLVNWSQGATTQAQTNGFTGPAISSARISNNWQVATQFVQAGINTRELTSLGGGTTPAYANGIAVEWYFSGVFTTTAAGTVSVTAAAPTPANTYTIGANSWASLYPVV